MDFVSSIQRDFVQPRVTNVQALYKNPDIILADDPTASLNIEQAKREIHLFKEAIRKYDKNVAVFPYHSCLFNEVGKIYQM